MRKASRPAATAGMLISGGIIVLFFGGLLVSSLCR
jgi:hypothetical protein